MTHGPGQTKTPSAATPRLSKELAIIAVVNDFMVFISDE